MKSTNRNQPCPCGSGRKYKRCCRKKESENEKPIVTIGVTYFRFCVTLLDCDPPVWRRILLPTNASFAELHSAIQACGWTDSHHWDFTDESLAEPQRIAGPSFCDGILDPLPDAGAIRLATYFQAIGDWCTYVYDYGDNWRHRVVLEFIERHNEKFERALLDGAGAFPPEGCGGTKGFARLREFVQTGKDSFNDEQNLRKWLDGSSLDEFDLEQAQRLFGKVLPPCSGSGSSSSAESATLIEPPAQPTVTLDKKLVDRFVERLHQSMDELADEFDLAVGLRRVSFTSHNAKVELEVATIRDDGLVMNKRAEEFLRRCHEFSLEQEHLGQHFQSDAGSFQIVGLRPRAKLPVVCRRSDALPTDPDQFAFSAEFVAKKVRASEGVGPTLRLLKP